MYAIDTLTRLEFDWLPNLTDLRSHPFFHQHWPSLPVAHGTDTWHAGVVVRADAVCVCACVCICVCACVNENVALLQSVLYPA
jgi:hypothetical protein